jgi:hypothetical protein
MKSIRSGQPDVFCLCKNIAYAHMVRCREEVCAVHSAIASSSIPNEMMLYYINVKNEQNNTKHVQEGTGEFAA